ncbi:MAG: methionyl-tRNA formyltransferase [Gammaproteobacteria bacterium]|uniref:methionyl-tRNA formyltransferase n=1 Tax=Rhodoferax sp. TaxID=50421 RepID=UPI0017B57C6B|nr:methionyl-tRNA formyltransferase [Rhodoferax sp.]MBU3900526.1 methionyl-tRNA formyltransferase [Gammaproteobacteria bacterium]MBA3057569.1 methionyl-tRNA formyltransferase [Rhodoferax sp.]MBU3996431.1 methionyl-tRNA formyltransferase [Gammaproteobacteria bacterium]MBU4079971.1 methionyl-tRNA formyltransferase [Gammaproteobacteria bacterium]MBU4113427.1 methionyl-tRNA formyltransferase [Gammaproteobacteria bacterium]
MRLIFAGTPEFARVALALLHASGHEIALVLTQPDRPAGRGLKLQPSAVKQYALDHGIALAQPRSLRLDGKYPQDALDAQALLALAQCDAMVVAAYGLILPQWVLDLPPLGCFNIHASLLPRWRGAAPIHRAIEAGDAQTGVTIMQMDAGLDTGAMLLTQAVPIEASDTTGSLHDRLAALGAELMVQALEQAGAGSLQPVAQATEGVSYAHKIEKHEAAIDWTQSAAVITQRIRAFNPFPGATAVLNGETLKVWQAEVSADKPPVSEKVGAILAVAHVGIAVAAHDSIVNITQLQRPGGKRLGVAEFLRGFALQPGMAFDPPGS